MDSFPSDGYIYNYIFSPWIGWLCGILNCILCSSIYFNYLYNYWVFFLRDDIFVLIDHPEYPVLQAMKESKTMMKGHKMDLFLLWLSFIGWCVLAVFTLGFGFLWVLPYMYTTTAHFYQHVSGNESY